MYTGNEKMAATRLPGEGIREWYYYANGTPYGPFAPEQVPYLYTNRIIDGNSFVWCQGLTQWMPLSQTALSLKLVSTSSKDIHNNKPMIAIMITSKAKILQLILLILSIVSALTVVLLKVDPPWLGTERENMLFGWTAVMRGVPIAGIMITIVLFNIGKRVPSLLTSLIFTTLSIISTVNIINPNDKPSLLILVIDVLAIAINIVCLINVFDRSNDYSSSYLIESKVVLMLSFYSVAVILAYYFMHFDIQDFQGWIPGLTQLNFFGAFTVKEGESFILHAIIAVLMILVLYFAWKKNYKIFLGVNIVLALLLIVILIKQLDMPYRTVFFYLVSAMVIVQTVLSALVFKSTLKPNLSKKMAELELLRSNGNISEETYQKELKKLGI